MSWCRGSLHRALPAAHLRVSFAPRLPFGSRWPSPRRGWSPLVPYQGKFDSSFWRVRSEVHPWPPKSHLSWHCGGLGNIVPFSALRGTLFRLCPTLGNAFFARLNCGRPAKSPATAPDPVLLLCTTGIVDRLEYFLYIALFVAFANLTAARWKTLRLLAVTARRDFRGAVQYAKLNLHMYKLARQDVTVGRLFQRTAARSPSKPCFVTHERNWTFDDVERWSNRVANCFAREGFHAGDEVALFAASRPETVMLWLGLSKIGVISSLVNNNLKQDSLVHCLTCVNHRAVVFTADLLQPLQEVRPNIVHKLKGVRFYVLGDLTDDALTGFYALNLEPLLEASSPDPPPACGGIRDRLLQIYTSGTTGLPKAAIIRHQRYIGMAIGTRFIMPVGDDDVIYITLPLYHIAACLLGCSQALLFGTTVVVRENFSASSFWDDCIRYRCTVMQHLGETCRYLLAQPPKPQDTQHSIRLTFGNGLRPEIWTGFAERFRVRDIREVYGSTEGNTHLVNIDNRVGAVGFVPTLCRIVPRLGELVFPIRIIKVDETTGVPLRDKVGMCIPCGPNEIGELVCKVRKAPMLQFDGYVDTEATRKKLYTDVFRKGDMAYASGDLLIMDELGYMYFRDRSGDTFRWKGENVSTTEVEGVILRSMGLTDCVVYGVPVPGSEGRAGMAAILDPDRHTDLDLLLRELRRALPAYAVPIFVRLLGSLDVTSTFKHKKSELQKQEFDVDRVDDPIYFLDPEADRYVPLDKGLHARLRAGQVRL